MTDYRDDILTVDELAASMLAGEKYQLMRAEIFLDMVRRLKDVESVVSKMTEIMLPREP